MKQARSIFITALSVMAFLTSSLCAQPVPAVSSEECEVNPYMACACVDDVDHPLFPEARPHLISVGADFLTAKTRACVKNGHRWVFMPGARVSYEYLRPDSIYVGINGEAGWFAEHNSHRVAEKPSLLQARLGYNLSYVGGYGYALVTPYIGVGVASSKVRFDKLSHVSATYLSLGLRSRYAVCSNWSIGCDAQAIRTLSLHHNIAKGKVAVADASNSSSSSKRCKKMAKVKLENRWTGEVAVPVTYYMGAEKEWSVECAPYVTGLTLSRMRPAYGARATLGYRF